jgi:hypothetical protein
VQPLQDLAQDRGAGVIVALDRTLPQRVAAGTLDQDRRPSWASRRAAPSPSHQRSRRWPFCLGFAADLQHRRFAVGGQHRPELGVGRFDGRAITPQSPAAQVGSLMLGGLSWSE